VLACPLAEVQLRQLLVDPVLSIVIPTYQRSDELALTVASIAGQIQGDLAHKVEIILTDNASGPDTVGKIKFLAAQYACVSYLVHKRDEGIFFQAFAAPWRARGRWTWVFGSDDLLLEGGLAAVVAMLEREQPGFATLNRKVFNHDLSEEMSGAANAVDDRRFERFEDLISAFGPAQLAFMSANIESTAAARAFDPEPYLKADSRHAHVAAYLNKHHGRPACYVARPDLVQRVQGGGRLQDQVANTFDFAVTLPILLDAALRAIDAPGDALERMTGDASIQVYDDPDGPTFVDQMLGNLLLSLAAGRYFTVSQRWALESILKRCAPHRLGQLAEIWQMQQTVQALDHSAETAQALVERGRRTCAEAARNFERSAAG
jgi:glycosyltransferase involved in cell wall biosynthesis